MSEKPDGYTAGTPTEPKVPSGEEPKTLYLFYNEWESGYHLVSRVTVDRANAESEAAEAATEHKTFGDLRLAGDFDELSERLDTYGVTLDEYAASIERSASMTAHPGLIAERFAALDSVDFEGDDDDNTPGDDEDFRPQHEIDEEIPVENVFMHVIQTSMDQDVPDVLLEEFCALSAPMFVDYTVSYVTRERLEPLIAALEGRGYTIVRDH